MSDACDIEWKKALDTTNEVVLEELGRGKAFLETLSKSLGIAGEFVVGISCRNADLSECGPILFSINMS